MTTINESFIVNKDTTDFNNNSIIKKGTIVKGVLSGFMPNGEVRITTDKGQIINLKDLQNQSFDWAKLGKNVLNNQGFPDTSNVTSTPVLCKDGTTLMQLSSPTGRYSDACMNNGGRAEKQPVVVNTLVYAKANLSPEEKFYESLGLKSSMFFTLKAKGRFLVAGVLVAGYFAYKKFKK